MRRTRAAIALTITVLVGYELLRGLLMPEATRAGGNLVVAGILYLLARWANATHEELGLSRWGTGLMVGMLALVAVSAVLALAALVPLTRNAFEEASVPPGIALPLLAEVLVVIPLGTVVVEEFAFRGSLFALLRRGHSTVVAVIASSFLFGLWHVIPSVWNAGTAGPEAALAASGLSQTTAVIVLATTAAGSVFCWLRLRSGSLARTLPGPRGNELGLDRHRVGRHAVGTGTSHLHPATRRPRHPFEETRARRVAEPERGIEPLTSSLPWRRSAD